MQSALLRREFSNVAEADNSIPYVKMKEQITQYPDSTLWKRATRLWQANPHRLDRLEHLMLRAKPIAGLYEGENPSHFPIFVQHVRNVLSRSPRTLLRQAVKAAMEEQLGKDEIKARKWKELCHEVYNNPLSSGMEVLPDALAKESPGGKHIRHVGAYMDSLSAGRLYQRLQHLVKGQRQQEQRSSKDRMDIQAKEKEDLRAQITKGLRAKRNRKRLREGILDQETSLIEPISLEEEVEDVLVRALESKSQNRKKLDAVINAHVENLKSDHEYNFYHKTHQLWKECGGFYLWERYRSVDLAICRKRGARGSNFENIASEICFASIVLNLHDDATMDRSKAYHYHQNVYWWKNGKRVGEVDLVVVHENEVVALCEMKTSPFLIASGTRQHEAKIDMAIGPNKTIPAGLWRLGYTWQSSFPLAKTAELYLATTIPNETTQLGVEPALANAICDGVREQGIGVSHPSSLELCEKILETLLGKGCTTDETFVQDTIEYLDSIPRIAYHMHSKDEVDFEQLRMHILQEESHLGESPQACFTRFRNNGRLLIFDGFL